MKSYISFMDGLPTVVKFIFALPGLDILWAIYRIFKGAKNNNVITLVAGIVWLLAGWAILWIIDLITIVLSGKPTVFVD